MKIRALGAVVMLALSLTACGQDEEAASTRRSQTPSSKTTTRPSR